MLPRERRAMTVKHWTTIEIKILRNRYETADFDTLLDLLPDRTYYAIIQRANHLGLKRPRRCYGSTAEIDDAIRRYYQSPPRSNGVRDLANRIGRPRWWVSQRAGRLGVVNPRNTKQPDWTDAEEQLLADNHGKDVYTIRNLFARHGYQRSANAIAVKRKRMQLSSRPDDVYTANSLARVMGIDCKTVIKWIEQGMLTARRQGTQRLAIQGGDHYAIKERHVRLFVINHPAHVDIRKCDKFWFIDLLAGTTATDRQSAA